MYTDGFKCICKFASPLSYSPSLLPFTIVYNLACNSSIFWKSSPLYPLPPFAPYLILITFLQLSVGMAFAMLQFMKIALVVPRTVTLFPVVCAGGGEKKMGRRDEER